VGLELLVTLPQLLDEPVRGTTQLHQASQQGADRTQDLTSEPEAGQSNPFRRLRLLRGESSARLARGRSGT
jgi:hypothetical protein